MRKNSIRKLIHGILDLLPLFVIPIFAININQKSVEPISIEVQEKVSVDFNQNITQQYATYTDTFTNTSLSTYPYIQYNFIESHTYVLRFDFSKTENSNVRVRYPLISSFLTNGTHSFEFSTFLYNYISFQYQSTDGLEASFIADNINLFDLTKMYGVGNEPTLQEFNNTFINSYYPYTESQKILINKPNPTTYDDTDIGSQFLYSLYISTDEYFNMNNVFNLNSVYQWFEMNIFNGSAPLSIYIVWNIIIYELVMDLLMLLYALFMFFIDACQKLIDKPLNSIK